MNSPPPGLGQRLVLRLARADESATLSQLAYRSKAHWGYSESFMRACQAELSISPAEIESPLDRVVVAQQGLVVTGYYRLSRVDEATFELEAMFVEPEYIGKGVGRALFADAVDFARSSSAGSMLIQADPNAAGFYRSQGARLVAERESQSIPGRLLPELVLTL